MNSARRDLEALNVLTVPSSERSLFEVPPGEMTDEQLDVALRLLGHPTQQPSIDQCGDEVSGPPGDAGP
jgi:hypothetical protein